MNPNALQRVAVNWAAMQPKCVTETGAGLCVGGPGAISWTGFDSTLSDLQSHGVRVLLLPFTAPNWAWSLADCGTLCGDTTSGTTGQPILPPADNSTDLSYWASFVKQIVQHADQNHPGELAGVELWNEANSLGFWNTVNGPDATRFARLECAAYPAIRSVDSGIPVVSGGIADVSSLTMNGSQVQQVPTGTFLTTAYGAGLASCMTDVGVHIYVPGQADISGARGTSWVVNTVETAENSGRDPGRPIWVTETGYCTNVDPNCGLTVSQTDQANGEECTYQLLANYAQVQAVIVNTLYDTGPNNVGSSTAGSGVYVDDNTPKLAVTMWTDLFKAYGQNVPGITMCSQEYNWSGNGYSW